MMIIMIMMLMIMISPLPAEMYISTTFIFKTLKILRRIKWKQTYNSVMQNLSVLCNLKSNVGSKCSDEVCVVL